MSVSDEIFRARTSPPEDPAKRITYALINHMFAHGLGFDDAWNEMDEEWREKMLSELVEIVRTQLPHIPQ